ncbi:MAG: carbamate kinase [Deltaproteobacteria bacterium]|nr:MAG: carbamate kinase [Deltaproteobacteria bacterium]
MTESATPGAEGKLVVLAIGGNSLIKDRAHKTVQDQYNAICETMEHVADLVLQGYRVVITHGNGPQVGFIMRRSEIARKVEGLHIVPLVSCVADTQGALGWQIQQALDNALRRRGVPNAVGKTVTVVTQVEVDPNDPAFKDPSKPVGEFYEDDQLPLLKQQHPDWILKNDANRGWRRVVPSPKPKKIIEKEAISTLIAEGFNVVTVGGGGIPVVREDGDLKGVDAVIDKDFATALLATAIGAPLMIISTGVRRVSLHFGTPDETPLKTATVAEMKRYMGEGHFAPGSMAPKVQAAIQFLENGGREVIITHPEALEEAVLGREGTHIIP